MLKVHDLYEQLVHMKEVAKFDLNDVGNIYQRDEDLEKFDMWECMGVAETENTILMVWVFNTFDGWIPDSDWFRDDGTMMASITELCDGNMMLIREDSK